MLRSILNTERQVSTVRVFYILTTHAKLNAIHPIVEKFGDTIKHFTVYVLTSPNPNISDIVDILELIPNVEHLMLSVDTFGTVNQPKRRRLDDFNLRKLKRLELRSSSDDILSLFNRLPPGVLLELYLPITSEVLNKSDEMFKRQTNIRKLTVDYLVFGQSRSQVEVSVDSFDHLNLESLDWQQNYFNFNIASILSHQPKLKSLRLDDIVDVNVMNVVTDQLRDLESLTINVSATTAASIGNIRKLKNLKHLAVVYRHNSDMVLFDAVTKLDNSRISSMDVVNFTNITPAQYHALSMSAPKLKELRCRYDRSTFGAIMAHFNFVECLRFVSYGPHDAVIDPNDNYFANSCVNPKLIELSIGFALQNETRFLEKLVADVPNLKRLTIKSQTPIITSQFQLILSGFPRLAFLSIINGASTLTQSDFNVSNSNLRYISLKDANPRLIENGAELITLRGIFDVVKINDNGKLTAAADMKTFIREKDMQAKANC